LHVLTMWTNERGRLAVSLHPVLGSDASPSILFS
jgi:hypothetical protein